MDLFVKGPVQKMVEESDFLIKYTLIGKKILIYWYLVKQKGLMKTLQYLGTIGQVSMIISVIILKFKPAFQLDCYFYESVSTEKAPLSLLRPSRTSIYNTLGTQCSIGKYRHSYLHTPLF